MTFGNSRTFITSSSAGPVCYGKKNHLLEKIITKSHTFFKLTFKKKFQPKKKPLNFILCFMLYISRGLVFKPCLFKLSVISVGLAP